MRPPPDGPHVSYHFGRRSDASTESPMAKDQPDRPNRAKEPRRFRPQTADNWLTIGSGWGWFGVGASGPKT